jgi:hypothetical protein
VAGRVPAMRLALLAILLAGCGPGQVREVLPLVFPDRGEHRTPCGVWHDFEGIEAGELIHAEAVMVQRVEPHVPYICNYIQGWRIEIHPETDGRTFPAMYGDLSKRWAGTVLCGTARMMLPNTKWATNAYAHEFLHLIECPMTDREHESWSWQWDAEGRL